MVDPVSACRLCLRGGGDRGVRIVRYSWEAGLRGGGVVRRSCGRGGGKRGNSPVQGDGDGAEPGA